jgi:hypothetical protein
MFLSIHFWYYVSSPLFYIVDFFTVKVFFIACTGLQKTYDTADVESLVTTSYNESVTVGFVHSTYISATPA